MTTTSTQDKEVHILLEDQQRINRFARLNSLLEELKEEQENKKNEVQSLEDACTEIMMLEDDDEQVPYQVGEVFVLMSQSQAQEALESSKARLNAEMGNIREQIEGIKEKMSDLKTSLYAKFGDSINLEPDED